MTESELCRAVATITGEPLAEVRRHGFRLLDVNDFAFDDPAESDDDSQPIIDSERLPDADLDNASSRPPLVIDWDELDSARHARSEI